VGCGKPCRRKGLLRRKAAVEHEFGARDDSDLFFYAPHGKQMGFCCGVISLVRPEEPIFPDRAGGERADSFSSTS
jgi:hypothetical protein